jgi:hypothetical protein
LISPCPQPANRKTADSKAADVIKALEIFNCSPLVDAEKGKAALTSSRQ